jgi:hypothetical protein
MPFDDKISTHIHHIKPFLMGGKDKPSNLLLLHRWCHVDMHHQADRISALARLGMVHILQDEIYP